MYSIEETSTDTIVARNFPTRDEAQRVTDEYNYQAANGVWNERNYVVTEQGATK